MTSYGIWDGSSCPHCVEESCYLYNGIDEDTPCRHCGWFRGIFDGSRFPPGYCASSWYVALRRIRDLRDEFPGVPKEVVSEMVQRSGENDTKANGARALLEAHRSSSRLSSDNSDVENDDVSFAMALLQDQKNKKQEYRGTFVDDWTMKDMESIALGIAREMKIIRDKMQEGRGEESCDSEYISDVTGWSFNREFDKDIAACVIAVVQASTGCFHCNGGGGSEMKGCSKCKIARYCDKECQTASWRRGFRGNDEEPHKERCPKLDAARNECPGWRTILEMYTQCLMEGSRALEMALSRRTSSFLDEVVRCSSASWRESTARTLINFDVSIQRAPYGEAWLMGHTMFLDDKSQAGYNGPGDPTCLVHNVLWKVLESGYDELPEVPDFMKVWVVSHVGAFLKEAKQRGISVGCITASDGARWLYEQKWHRNLCLAAPDCDVKLTDTGDFLESPF